MLNREYFHVYEHSSVPLFLAYGSGKIQDNVTVVIIIYIYGMLLTSETQEESI